MLTKSLKVGLVVFFIIYVALIFVLFATGHIIAGGVFYLFFVVDLIGSVYVYKRRPELIGALGGYLRTWYQARQARTQAHQCGCGNCNIDE